MEITKEAAEPKRLSTDGQRQELRKKKEAVKQLPSDEDIDKMNTQEIKEVLKKIVSIIKTRYKTPIKTLCLRLLNIKNSVAIT
ncbi:MAG: hypothetical protein L3V56_03600 [Candidatus Magnetoovum sp. WYHC-5]|nr:hypothetical protein [Candidatus Magnetoovum sp. WYHC-5]